MVNMMTLTLKTEKYIKDKYDEAALDHLRQKKQQQKNPQKTEEITAKLSKIPKTSPDHTKHL